MGVELLASLVNVLTISPIYYLSSQNPRSIQHRWPLNSNAKPYDLDYKCQDKFLGDMIHSFKNF